MVSSYLYFKYMYTYLDIGPSFGTLKLGSLRIVPLTNLFFAQNGQKGVSSMTATSTLIPPTRVERDNVAPSSATTIVSRHFKGQVVDSEQVIPTNGIMPSGGFVVCGECTDEGGGSSGQCK